LTQQDSEALAARWIDPVTANRQYLRRVDSAEGAEIVGRNGAGNYAGILIPNVLPGAEFVREYRLRRDCPDMENGKPKAKYVAPPGRANLLYFAIGIDPAWLKDPQIPIVIVEGEFKCISLARAAVYERRSDEPPRFLAVGVSGVWSWRGTIGKTSDADGNRVDVKGAIPDLDRLARDDRRVLILFDADLVENESVQAARRALTKVLRSRAAQVTGFQWPEDRPREAKGIDDLLAAIGPEKVLQLIDAALAAPVCPADLIAFHFADTGNGDRLAALHGANLRYCFPMRKWLIWEGRRWEVDETGRALKLTKRTMIDFLRQAVNTRNEAAEKFARTSLDARRLNAALTLAQPELPISPADLDRAPHLLNFVNGTVDLRSGALLPHKRGDLITKMVHYRYNPEAKCPRWLTFLDQIMGPEARDLIGFLQLALGYSVTGETNEKAVFVAHGSGDNGKTTLLSTVRDLISEYSATVGLDLLTAKDESNNVAAARAKLQGVRFASSSETEEGQRLNAARLKRICQGPGGVIEACRKFENPITFSETHKLWIDCNHKPELPASDSAVWNRLHLIPFTVTIPKDRQDRQLLAKLLGEAEGILAWLVEGARRWYAEGLPASQTVADATAHWREEMDRLRAYLDEHTEKSADVQAYVLNKDLYTAYRSWCEENGERALSQVKFSGQMEDMGYQKKHTEHGRTWCGLRFRRTG
jgi:P4 family phage/plasmid primase-like protien